MSPKDEITTSADAYEFTEDPRFRQCNKEMRVVTIYWLLLLVAMLSVAWYIGGNTRPGNISFIFVWPDWFFWSGVVVSAIFVIVPWFVIRAFFKDMNLTDPEQE